MHASCMHSRPASLLSWQHRRQPLRCPRNSSRRNSSRAVRLKAAEDPAATSPPAAPQSSVIITKRGPFVWGSSVATQPSITHAVDTAVADIQGQWQQQQQQQQQQESSQQQQQQFEPNLAIVFASCNYGAQLQDVVAAVRRACPTIKHIFGCSAYGVCGGSAQGPAEIEGEPGVSISLAQLQGVELSLVHTLRSVLPTEDASPEAWADLVGVSPVEPLTQSPTPADASLEEEGEESTDQQQQQQQEQQEAEVAIAADRQPDAKQQELVQKQQKQEQEAPESTKQQQKQERQQEQQQQQQQQREQESAEAMEQPKQQPDSSSGSSSGSSSDAAVKEFGSSWMLRRKGCSRQAEAAAEASSAVSFLVMCDPKFPQVQQLLAGLDFAFPEANKAGLVLSQGQQNRKRVMFAWSADGGVEAGSAAWKRKTQQRRQQQQAELAAAGGAAAAAAAAGVDRPLTEAEEALRTIQGQQARWNQAMGIPNPPATSSSSSGEEADEDASSSTNSSGSSSSSSRGGSSSAAAKDSSSSSSSSSNQATDSTSTTSSSSSTTSSSSASSSSIDSTNGDRSKKGLFSSLFGSLLSGLSDDTDQQQQQQRQQQQQQREGSSLDKADAEGEEEEEEEEEDESDPSCGGTFMYGAAVLAIKGPVVLEPITCQGYRTVTDKVWLVGDTSRDGDLIMSLKDPDVNDLDDDADDDEDDEDDTCIPLEGLNEMLKAIWEDDTEIDDLVDKVAVAIAPDSWSPIGTLTPEQYTVAAISEVWNEQSYIRIDGQARTGHRLRFVLRDEEGMRDDLRSRLLGVKRAELAAVMSGTQLPQPLAAMLFSDIGRGSLLYETPNYESGVVSSFLPVPLSGAFGAAQFSTVNGAAALYERTSVIGVWRALPQPDAGNGDSSAAATDSSSSSSSGGGNATADGGEQTSSVQQ